MQCVKTPLQDAFLIKLHAFIDDRGAFCRLFCSHVLEKYGLQKTNFVQVNLSDNPHKGTLRGMHFQKEPYLESKIIYCLKGKVFDVILDLRQNSPTYKQHFGIELDATSGYGIYIPKGFAHGFLTLTNQSQLLYLMSDFYQSGYEGGYRFDDPAFNIQWPFRPKILSPRDQQHPSYKEKYAFIL